MTEPGQHESSNQSTEPVGVTATSVCVTGATGFVGAQVAARLSVSGREVRVTFRDRARLEALREVDVEPIKADALDRDSLMKAFDGCDVLFHTAGLVASRPRSEVWRVNAVAPRIAVECAAAAGVRRVVLTSSVAAIGPAPPGRPADESDPFPDRGVGMIYADSKREGERAAFVAGERLGVEVVSVNPAYVLGAPVNRSLPGETSTRIVGNYLRGRLPAIVDSYTNIVDVEDVANGHVLAAELGKPGERYILGGENLRWSDVMQQVAELAGRQPLIALPPEIAAGANLLGRVRFPGLPLEGIRLMAPDWRYSSDKAERELGYTPRTARETLERPVNWYLELIESGRLDGARRGSFDLLAAGVRLGDRLRLLVPLKAAGRLAGRKTVL